MKKTSLFLKVAVAAGFLLLLNIGIVNAQNKTKLAVISMDTKGLKYDNQSITNMVYLELEKANIYEVFDKYDVANIIKDQGIKVDECFGRTCLVDVGKLLGAEKMLSGSVEKFGNKIVFIMRLIDVKSERIEKTDVMEFIDQEEQIQTMVRLTLNNIMGIENDKLLLDLLVNYDQPIISSKTTVKLNGPRVGFTYTLGQMGEIMQAPKSKGGFNMYPVTNLLGYQFEQQFLSSGDFQALLEFLPALNGLESGLVNPSLTIMLGFRFNKSGLEFGLGPVVRLSRIAEGYYDADGIWRLRNEMPDEDLGVYTLSERLDSRGKYKVSSGMIFAAGKTFRSGYLNVPVNLYFSPRKDGSIIGFIVGFNVAKRPKLNRS
ncbi:MAG: hypothetical protein ACOCWC_02730 [Bacteroidota bacterium]